ncbi:hypothetical protein HCDSEM_118 [Candidatus Hodgkinia cicadicola Dsem]|nr:hypothetical protein HCDSEM_118 [Candidatus Hodgkinia cicadicola Dsem]
MLQLRFFGLRASRAGCETWAGLRFVGHGAALAFIRQLVACARPDCRFVRHCWSCRLVATLLLNALLFKWLAARCEGAGGALKLYKMA